MKTTILVLSAVLAFNAQARVSHGDNEKVPNAKERYEPKSGYTPFPGFPRMELVKEGEGTRQKFSALIKDPEMNRKLNEKYFTSLQVRDLSIRSKDVYASGTTVHFPFAVSLKHSEGEKWNPLPQGTIEVAGEILVIQERGRTRVEVDRFSDSQTAERVGRLLGVNDEVDLEFARKVVVPVLEAFFNDDPANVKTLLELTAPLSLPGKT